MSEIIYPSSVALGEEFTIEGSGFEGHERVFIAIGYTHRAEMMRASVSNEGEISYTVRAEEEGESTIQVFDEQQRIVLTTGKVMVNG